MHLDKLSLSTPLLFFVVVALCLGSASAAERTHLIREPWRVLWGEQIIRYQETFAKPGVALDTLRKTRMAENPSQSSGVVFSPLARRAVAFCEACPRRRPMGSPLERAASPSPYWPGDSARP